MDESERKRLAVEKAQGEIDEMFEKLNLTPDERAFAEDQGGIVFKQVVGEFGKEGVPAGLRVVVTSAALAFAMILTERYAKERGHH